MAIMPEQNKVHDKIKHPTSYDKGATTWRPPVHGMQLALCFYGNIELGIYDVEGGSFPMPECTYAYVFYVANPSQKFYLHF